MLNGDALKVIEDILNRGKSAEVRKRKGEIVIVEIDGKLKYRIPTNG